MRNNLVDLYEKLTDKEKQLILIAMREGSKVSKAFSIGIIPFFDTSLVIWRVCNHLSAFPDKQALLKKLIQHHLGDEVEVSSCYHSFIKGFKINIYFKPDTNKEEFFLRLPKVYDENEDNFPVDIYSG